MLGNFECFLLSADSKLSFQKILRGVNSLDPDPPVNMLISTLPPPDLWHALQHARTILGLHPASLFYSWHQCWSFTLNIFNP